jgi:hypothetical protein
MLKKIIDYSKYIITIAGAATILWGAVRSINRSIDSVTRQTEVIQAVRDQQAVVLDSIYSLSKQIQGLSLQVDGINDNTVLIGNYVEGINKSFSYHLKRSPEVTKEDYAAMMQIIEELKKNDGPTVWQ